MVAMKWCLGRVVDFTGRDITVRAIGLLPAHLMIMQLRMVMSVMGMMIVAVEAGFMFVGTGRKLAGHYLQGQPSYQYT